MQRPLTSQRRYQVAWQLALGTICLPGHLRRHQIDRALGQHRAVTCLSSRCSPQAVRQRGGVHHIRADGM